MRRPRGDSRLAPVKRRLGWIAGGVVLLLGLIAGGLAVAYPAVAATSCPACYRLESLGDGLYAERGLTAVQKDQLIGLAAEAKGRVEAFYGGRTADPRLLACVTDGCYQRIGGGGEKGMAVLNRAVMLSPRGLDAVIASHEMSHVELHHRLDGEVPQWFDEGLAVVVSDDLRYLGPATAAERCRASPAPGETLPVTLTGWLDAASADEQVYAKAACRVSRWLEDGGGRTGVLKLIDRLNSGEDFPAVR